MADGAVTDPGRRGEWAGYYLDGRTAARRAAVIRLTFAGIEAAIEGGEMVRWPYDEVRQTQGFHPGEPVRLEHGGDVTQALVIPDGAFVASLREAAGLDARRFRRAGRGWALVVLGAVLGAVVLGLVLHRWGIPAAARAVATVVPVEWEDRLGAAVVERLAPPDRRCTEESGQAVLDRLLGRITAAEPSPYRFRIVVLDSPEVNAFAAPGGHLVVVRGLLERTRTPEQLAGVLAHEAQHVLRRHTTRAIIQRASTGLLVAALFGDVSGVIAFAADSAATLAYSREHEVEADVEGLRLLRDAGLDPAGMTAFFEVMERDGPGAPAGLGYLSTHPSTEDRIARLRALDLASPAPAPSPALNDAEWQALRAICDGGPPRR